MFPSLRRRRAADVETKTVETINWSTADGQMPDWLAGRRRRNRWEVERAVYGAYERTVWLWKGVSLMAGHFSRLPFQYRVAGTDTIVDDHPVVRLLQPHAQTNPMEKGRAFKRRLFIQVMFSPRGAFVEFTRSRGGDIIRLDLLPPGRTRPVPGSGQELIARFETRMPDGSTRTIDRDKVWWIREPHPLDPYRADTVMPSLGASVEMDDLARQINVHWMLNDGLLRAIVGIKGGLNATDTEKLERRFGRGPVDAGKVTIVNADEVTYADVSARPRDMQYQELTRNAREEILGGIGVPESLLGISKGSTYDNAAQDKFNYWSETMPGPIELIAAELVDPKDDRDLEPVFDLSGVEALQLPKQRQREEARLEVQQGLRSIESYAELAGYEVYSTEETRALWLPNTGKAQIPQTAEDVKTRDKLREEMAAQMAPNPGGDGGPDGEGGGKPAAGDGGRQPRAAGNPAPARAAADGNTRTGAREQGDQQPAGKVALGAARYGLKSAQPATRTVDVADVGQADAEEAAAAALAALTVRWAARTAARLQSPKARKGTRHWQPDPAMPADLRVGAKALDTEAAVDAESWEQDTAEALSPLIEAAAVGAATTAVAVLAGGTAAAGAAAASTVAAGAAAEATAGALTAAQAAVTAAATAAKNASLRLAADLAAGDAAGESIEQLVRRIDTGRLLSWAKKTARHAAATAVTGGLYAAGQAAGGVGLDVTATWTSRRDERTRPTHKAAHGQIRPVGTAFKVGGAALRFPRDPAGPADETIGCRCHLRLSVKVAARQRAGAGR